ncbi:MAG: hypothetical protein VR69_13550 [Peptococcaceae bacterium BRH_c4b]|nr:MAG: hypothetical protein VR69_13550 [Peptococcaceae bacterium BRH_c4b]
MDNCDNKNIFNSKAAIFLAAMCFQTYPFFLVAKIYLKQYGLRLRKRPVLCSGKAAVVELSV